MKNIRFFLSEIFHFLIVKFSVYLNGHVFVMNIFYTTLKGDTIFKFDDVPKTSHYYFFCDRKGSSFL